MNEAEQARLLIASQLATVGSLAGALIHEVNNTTGFVALASGQLEKMAQRALDAGESLEPEQILALAKEIVEAAKQARDDVAAFQTVAGMGRAGLSGSVDMRKILLAAMSLAKAAHRSKATIESTIDELVPFPPSYVRLGPVVAALLLNALQATPEGNLPYSITLRAFIADQELVIDVHNSGTQPSTKPLEDLFEPLRSERAASQSAGLGLYLVRQTVVQLGGTCGISADTEGTRVTLRVPVPEI
jgi:signal transduction histidine kinase